MSITEIVEELKRIYECSSVSQKGHRQLTEQDIQRWCIGSRWSRPQLLDEIARSLALGFHADHHSFEFCDSVVNDLFDPAIDLDDGPPKLFWKVYLAFDEGEYSHRNNWDEDPVLVYTRPMITQIVSEFKRL